MTKRIILTLLTFFGVIVIFMGTSHVFKDQQNFKLTQQEALAGNLIAQHNMGLMYFTGDILEQNNQEAFMWFYKAAEHGSAASQYYVGLMYKKGLGVSQNDQEALKWLQKSADQDNKLAQKMLKEK
ncbi:MAG: tetratricopeptide repeat protein [Janthinobacterium lividum]